MISSIFDAGSMRLDVLMREAILNRRSMEDILTDMEFIGDPGAAAAIREAWGRPWPRPTSTSPVSTRRNAIPRNAA